MRSIFGLILFIIYYVSFGQVTFVINELPETHDFNKDIYISGSFEGWTGGSDGYKLSKSDNQYSITLPKEKACNVLFKFTLGSWETEELDAKGDKIDNRNYTCKDEPETVYIKIVNWGPMDSVVSSTALENVKILSETFKIPQLERERKIWMHLPPNYKTSNKSFPVIYMHDGQNLFDNNTSYSGEWEVDETLNKLFKEKGVELIVVGIDNGGEKRLDEYSPWKNDKYGGGEGIAYMDFIVNSLKPYIDSHYKTLTDKSNTGVIGSSMGGLISHYAALKYPEVFGKIGVYSPAFWFAPDILTFSKTNGNIQDTKIYFLAGGKEEGNTSFNEISQTVSDMNTVIGVLNNQGFPIENIQSKVVPEGEHNEKLWRESFEETILWLFPETVQERKFVKAKLNNNQLQVEVSDGMYISKFYSPKIVETTFIPKGENHNPNSHAVVLDRTFSNVDYTESESQVVFKTEDYTVKINKKPFNISYCYKGKKLTEEKNGYYETDDFENIDFKLTNNEILYGGGARALGMNRRGHRLQLYNKAHYGYETESELMNYTMPIVISSNQYMIHFDNASIGYLDLDSKGDNTLTYETISGRKTYQVIAGDSWFDLIDNYTDLTGKQPLPPRWALGNFSSRFGYHSQQEVEETIAKFKEENIPVDAIILDLYWFGKDIQGTMGNLEVYKDSFPDMKQMVSNLKSKGVKTVLITEPFVLSTSKKWQEADQKQILAKDTIGNSARYDFYFGNTGIVDIYKKEGRDWFWNIYKEILGYGVKGLWGDLGEPEVLPSWVAFGNNKKADEIHNIYGHDWAKLIFEGYKKEYPNERPFILMRAGYSGSQRFGMIPWSGDVNRTWGGLQSQTEIALQMAMQGLAYMHSDLGGFAGANLDDELYTRWLQYGVFQPIYRPHAQEEVPSEPVFREPQTKARAKKSIELRYRMLPYNYNLAFQNSQTGSPLMRPVFFEEPQNEKQLVNAKTYFWGEDFLVTPIINPDVKEKQVYFPKNHVWFEFYTDENVSGGQTKTVSVTMESIPTYVKAGAFIPLAELVQTTDNYKLDKFDLHYYYHDAIDESERTFYNDDGLTKNAFEKEMYELLEFESEIEGKWLEVDFEAETGNNYQTNTKHINLIVHNIGWKPNAVKVNGKKVSIDWQSNNTLSIPVTWNTSKEIEIKIKLK